MPICQREPSHIADGHAFTNKLTPGQPAYPVHDSGRINACKKRTSASDCDGCCGWGASGYFLSVPRWMHRSTSG